MSNCVDLKAKPCKYTFGTLWFCLRNEKKGCDELELGDLSYVVALIVAMLLLWVLGHYEF